MEAGAAVCTWPTVVFDLETSVERGEDYDDSWSTSEDEDRGYSDTASGGEDTSDSEHEDTALAIVIAAAPTAPCEPGFWLATDEDCRGLTACMPGHYCPGHRARTNAALPCPAGTYGPLSGAVSVAQCRACPPERPYSAPRSTDWSECTADVAPAPAPQPAWCTARSTIEQTTGLGTRSP